MGASEKRKDYISWDEYFMGIAMLSVYALEGSEYPGGCVHSGPGAQDTLHGL